MTIRSMLPVNLVVFIIILALVGDKVASMVA